MKTTDSGWIKLHRQILEWEWFDDPNTFRLFIYCLLKANHTEKKYRGELVNRGTFLTSLEQLSKDTKISVQSIRTCLSRLESTNELTSKRSKQGTVIQVVNYDKYQVPTHELTDNQQDTNKIVTTTKNDNKEEEVYIHRKFKHLSINNQEYNKLLEQWSQDQVDEILDSIENYSKNTTYTSLYLTARKWLNKQYPTKPQDLPPIDRIVAVCALQSNQELERLKTKGYTLEQIKQYAE